MCVVPLQGVLGGRHVRHQRTCDGECPTTSATCRKDVIEPLALPVVCMLPLFSCVMSPPPRRRTKGPKAATLAVIKSATYIIV